MYQEEFTHVLQPHHLISHAPHMVSLHIQRHRLTGGLCDGAGSLVNEAYSGLALGFQGYNGGSLNIAMVPFCGTPYQTKNVERHHRLTSQIHGKCHYHL